MLDMGTAERRSGTAIVAERLCDMAGDIAGPPAATAIPDQVASGGKMIRATLTLDVAHALGVDGVPLATSVEALHLASLIHDDLCDGARVRRGGPSVWAEYGAGTAIASGDLLIARAFGALAEDGTSAAARMRLAERAVALTVRGQLADLAARGTAPLSLARYLRMAARKSGPLLGLGPGLVLITVDRPAQADRAMRAARWLAIAYQVADDLADRDEDAAHNAPNIVAIAGPDAALRLSSAAMRKAGLIAATLPPGVSEAFAEVGATIARKLPRADHAL